jgi:flagellar assembly protein FliH
MRMTAGVKFLFDEDFAAGAKPRAGAVPQSQHDAAVAEAEARGHRNGLAAGRAAAEADTERRLVAALAKAANGIDALAKRLEDIEARLEREAAELAVATAGRLAPSLIEREPFAEIAALVSDCLRHLVSAPHVVVRVADPLYEEACSRLNAIAERSGFAGRLIVLADPDIAVGDCRIEWADGGVTRDRAAVERAIGEAVERYLATRATVVGSGGVRSTAA